VRLVKAAPASDLSRPKQLDEAVKLCLEHGLRGAADLISEYRAERYPVRDWEYGSCIWCEVIDGKRRKATLPFDLGGGPPTCEKHADPDGFPDPPADEWAEPPESEPTPITAASSPSNPRALEGKQ